jgi:hypothetical protein
MMKSYSYVDGLSLFAAFHSSDGEMLRGVLAIVALAALFGLVVWLSIKVSRRFQQRRVEKIQKALSGLGFTLRVDHDELVLLVGLFKIGQRGDWRQVLNPFESALPANGSTQLMDYYFQVGSGKSRRGLRQTLALIFDKQCELPAFVLAPEGFFSRVAQNFGAKDIDFDAYPKFSGMFKLQGDDESAVRALFTPAVIEELERHPGITLEGQGGYVLVFRAGKSIKPENFPQFHEEAQCLAQLFLR